MMKQRAQRLAIAASVIVTGCAAAPGDKIKIRPIGDVAAQTRPANEQIAYARGQLAMGSVGLALEAFRKALRDQPDSVDALAGVADSYAAMGRSDLARRYYEAALAIAPHQPVLLQAVSQSAPAQASVAPVREQTPALSPVTATAPAVPQIQDSTPPVRAPAATVSMRLPPASTPEHPSMASAAPRLERLSPGEVALVTTPKPLWQAVVVSRTRVSTTVRWVPVRTAAVQPRIELLNAARHQGLAARTRQLLAAHGWRKLAIGNAPRVRTVSLVLYPSQHQSFAKILAARLGFRANVYRGEAIVVLLGRDAARPIAGQLGG